MSRKIINTKRKEINFIPLQTLNIDPILSSPISNGLCTYSDIYKLSLIDFYNMNEILAVKFANEELAYKAAEKDSKNGNNN